MSDLALLGWLFGWSGLATALAWLLPARLQAWGILACGVGLLASVSMTSLALLAAGTLLTFLVHRHAAGNRTATGLGIATVVGGFAVFMASGEHTASGIGAASLLPIGLAFYSLRLLHYLVESYKGNLRPHGLGEVLCYQFLPSALPVGPIHRFDEFLRDLRLAHDRGYAVTTSLADEFTCCLAAPIPDQITGRPLATLCFVVPVHTPEERRAELVQLLVDSSRTIAAKLS